MALEDKEIIELLAEFIGCIKWDGFDDYNGEYPIYYSDERKFIVCINGGDCRRWDPLENISDAWEVEEMVKEKGLEIRYCIELRQFTGYGDFRYIHATPRERCDAVIKVIEDIDLIY